MTRITRICADNLFQKQNKKSAQIRVICVPHLIEIFQHKDTKNVPKRYPAGH